MPKKLNIFEVDQWTDCLADNSGKRPRISPATPDKGLTHDVAQLRAHNSELSPNYGFLFSKNDRFIGIDVDVDPSGQKKNATPTIPPAILFLLQSKPTHVHYSPNTHGIHIIYRVTETAQQQLNDLAKKQGACSTDTGALFDGDWRWDSSFLTFTDNHHELSADTATIDFDTLENIIGSLTPTVLAPAEPAPQVFDINSGLKLHPHVPSLTELTNLLEDVPATFNYLAKKACAALKHHQPTSNYEYWLLVGQACAHTAIYYNEFEGNSVEAIKAAFVVWSSRDPEFVSIEDAEKKFNSLLMSTHKHMKANEPTATYKVLVSLANGASLNFPVLRGKNLIPDPDAVKNYAYLINHDELSLWQDTMAGGYTWCGPESVIAKWFCPRTQYDLPRREGFSQVVNSKTLRVVLLPYLQNRFKQSVSASQATVAANHYCSNTNTTSAFKDWVDSEPWDGIPRFDDVCNSIEFADSVNVPLYTSYIRKSLLAMIGIHYWSADHPKIPAMLVLKGPQHTYKSSWAEWLLPPELSNFLGMANVETMIAAAVERDRLLSTRAVIVVNECEPMFTPRHEQKVKSSVDQETVTYRDLYEPAPVSRQRTALIIGTTNKQDLFTGTMGTRKIWQIPVKQCDSMLILKMNKQQLYAEIKHVLSEYKKAKPNRLIQEAWAQSAAERAVVEEVNRRSKGTMGVDALLVEIFGDPVDTKFDIKDYQKVLNTGEVSPKTNFRRGNAYDLSNKPNCWQTTALLRFMKDQFPDDIIDRNSLRYAVTAYSELFTNTAGCTKEIFGNEKKWPVVRGSVTYSSAGKLFLLPPIGGIPDSATEDDME